MGYESQFWRELNSFSFSVLARRVFSVAGFFTSALFIYATITRAPTAPEDSLPKTECLIVEPAPFSSNPGSTCHGYRMYTLQVVGGAYNFTGSPLAGVTFQTRFKFPDILGKLIFTPEDYALGKSVDCFILIDGSLESLLTKGDVKSSVEVQLGFDKLTGPVYAVVATIFVLSTTVLWYASFRSFFRDMYPQCYPYSRPRRCCKRWRLSLIREPTRETTNADVENVLLDDVAIEALDTVEMDSFVGRNRWTPGGKGNGKGKNRENKHGIDWHQRVSKKRSLDLAVILFLGGNALFWLPTIGYLLDVYSRCHLDIVGLILAVIWAPIALYVLYLMILPKFRGGNEMYGCFDMEEKCFVLKKAPTPLTKKRLLEIPFDRMRALKMGAYTVKLKKQPEYRYGVLYLEYEYTDGVEGDVVEYGKLDSGTEQEMKLEYLEYKGIFRDHCRAGQVDQRV